MTDRGVPTIVAQQFLDAEFSLGAPDSTSEEDGRTTFHWDEEFTPEQDAEWQAIVKSVSREMQAGQKAKMRPHFDVLRAYENAGSPTNAQTQAAVKALIAVMRETWKE